MPELDIMSMGHKLRLALGDGRLIDLIDAISGNLRDEQLRDEGQALVKRRIDPGDDKQEQEQYHKVDLPGQDQAGSGQDGRGHAQAHDHAGSIDKEPGSQLALDGDLLVLIDLFVQAGQVAGFLVRGADLAHIFQCFLDAVGHAYGSGLCRFGALGRQPARAKQQSECGRHAPQTGKREPPVIDEQTCRDEDSGDIRAIQVAQHMAPHVLHAVHIAHQRLGEVGQIASAKVS